MKHKHMNIKSILFILLAVLMTACSSAGRVVSAGRDRRGLSEEEAELKRRFDYFYVEAVKQKVLGNHDAAYDLLQHCRQLDPHAGEVLYELGLYAMYMNDREEGVRLLKAASEQEPKNIWYIETLASYYLSRSEVEQALPCLERMAEINPNRSDVLGQLVGLYQERQEYQKAIDALNRIETLEGRDVRISLQKFQMYMELKDENKAFQELEQLAADNPNDLSYRVLIASQYMLLGKTDQAKAVFDEVARKDPDNTALRFALLDYYKQTHNDSLYQVSLDSLLYGTRTDEATRVRVMQTFVLEQENAKADTSVVMNVFRRILARPQTDMNMLQLYASYLNLKKVSPDLLADAFYRMLALEPDNQMALLQLLQINIRKLDYAEISRLCRIGTTYYPDELPFYYYKGIADYQTDQKDAAIAAFEEGVKRIKPDRDADIVSDMFSILGDLYHDRGQTEAAYAAYDSSLVYNPANLGCLNNYAYFLSLEKKDLEKAEEMSAKTIQAEPENITYLDTYAWILFVKGNFEEARLYMDKVLELAARPDQGDAEETRTLSGGVLEHAGDIYFQCGLTEKAVEFWRQAKELGGGTDLLDKKIRNKKYYE